MRPEIATVLKKHGINLFEFAQRELFSYTLRTDDAVSDELKDELKKVFHAGMEINFERISIPVQEPKPTVYVGEDLKKGDLCVFDPHSGQIKRFVSITNPEHPCFSAPYLPVDPVNHPSHYNSGKIEVIEFIKDQGLNFERGNAVKYISRAGKKDSGKEIQDLEKAVWYIKYEIECLAAKKEGREPKRPNELNK